MLMLNPSGGAQQRSHTPQYGFHPYGPPQGGEVRHRRGRRGPHNEIVVNCKLSPRDRFSHTLELHEDHEINVGVDILQYARAGPRSRYLVASRNSNDPRVRAREPADHTANFSWLGVKWCEIPDDCRRSVNSPNIPEEKKHSTRVYK